MIWRKFDEESLERLLDAVENLMVVSPPEDQCSDLFNEKLRECWKVWLSVVRVVDATEPT